MFYIHNSLKKAQAIRSIL